MAEFTNTQTHQLKGIAPVQGNAFVKSSALVLKDNRPQSAIQKKQIEGMSNKASEEVVQKKTDLLNTPLKRTTGINFVIQRVLNAINVAAKANQFLAAHEAEKQLIIEANTLLKAFSEHANATTFGAVNARLAAIRDAASAETNKQAALVQEYIDTADEAVRKTFMDTVLGKDSAVLKPLFNTLINQTPLGAGVDPVYKRRFLSYVLQGMKFPAGEGRFTELMGLLGGRNLEINQLLLGPSAGLQNPDVDNPLGEKTNHRDRDADAQLLEQHDGNLSEFINARFGGGDTRTANPGRAGIGDGRVNMERNQQVMPIYYGHTATKDVQAFTSPMFAANHHELGHVINKLKGKAGVHAERYLGEGELGRLTDEEEVYNISIDQHSDKALTDQMGLPTRIAHGAMGGLDAASPALNRGIMTADLNTWDHVTYQLTPGRQSALNLIKRIADGNWKPHTSYKSKPTGVTKIAGAVASLKNMGLGMKKQLEDVRRLAHTAAGEDSSNRKFVTTKFYEILDTMNVDTKNGLEILESKLEVLVEMGNF